MSVRVVDVQLRELDMQTRMPFRYGIAELRALPHAMVEVDCEIDGRRQTGIAADGLAPKWFTKDPSSSVEQDLRGMRQVIHSASDLASGLGVHTDVFQWWRALYAAQGAAVSAHVPPLLWNFGVSLLERAVIDAFCKSGGMTFARALRANLFGIDLGSIHPELRAASPADLLPAQPLLRCAVRHTVGLSDPLTDGEIPTGERLNDGLPQSLEAGIRTYGLTHFKVKLCGDAAIDLPRLRHVHAVLESTAPHRGYAFTLDGNEQFKSISQFKELWQRIVSDSDLSGFMRRLIFVEQPIHRDHALGDGTRSEMHNWPDRPPMIIDESDGDTTSLRRALACGYVGTSHKNCKGSFKGIANACLIAHRRREAPNQRYEMSGEDLANVGPVALLQDLAVCASLGLSHVERNGHHYFNGLSMWPREIQEATAQTHTDLYRCSPQGAVTLRIQDGRINLSSVVQAPFGLIPPLDVRRFRPMPRT